VVDGEKNWAPRSATEIGHGLATRRVEPAGVNEMLQIFVCVSVDLVHFFSFTLATHT
jgi:hypothetical protein